MFPLQVLIDQARVIRTIDLFIASLGKIGWQRVLLLLAMKWCRTKADTLSGNAHTDGCIKVMKSVVWIDAHWA
jgi:hypothetical protein